MSSGSRNPILVGVLLTACAMVSTLGALVAQAALRAAFHAQTVAHAFATLSRLPLALGVSQALGFGAAAAGAVALGSDEQPLRARLRLEPITGAAIVAAALGGLALQFPLSEVSSIAQRWYPVPLEERLFLLRLVTPKDAPSALAALMALVVIAPVCEEVLFRGFILRGVEARFGGVTAVLVSAALFGVSHVRPDAVAYASVAGLVLGALAIRTRSLFPGVVTHSACNAAPFLFSPDVVHVPGLHDFGEEVSHVPPGLLGASTLAAVLAFGYLYARSRDDTSEP